MGNEMAKWACLGTRTGAVAVTDERVLWKKGEGLGLLADLVMVDLKRENAGCERDL